MKKNFYISIFFLSFLGVISYSAYATDIANGDTQFLSSPLNVAIYCGDIVKNSITFSDEPYRLLKSISIGGQFVHDDMGEIYYTVNGDGHTFFKNQPCKCGEGCSGSDTIGWRTIFQDSLQPSADSVTITGAAIETFKRYTNQVDPARHSLVHFEGLGISPIWRLCHERQVTSNGACYTIGGDIQSNKTNYTLSENPIISWSSNYAINVFVRRDDGTEIGSGSQNNGVNDSGLGVGTYTYVLYGTGSNGNNASREFELDRITISIKKTSDPTCNSTSAVVNFPVTLQAQGGTGTYSWSAPGGTPPSSSDGTSSSFSTSYSTAGTKTVTVSSEGQSGTCQVTVTVPTTTTTTTTIDIDPSRVDIKANGSDGPLNVSGTAGLFMLSWGAAGGGTPNYSLCRSTGDWLNTDQPTSGSVLINVTRNVSFTKTYGISCSTRFATNTSDSVTVIVTAPDKQLSQQGCSLSVSSPSIRVGESATWIVQSQPSGHLFNWQGSDNGVTIKPQAGTGPTNRGEIYTYNKLAEYERYAEVQFLDKICTTNKVRLSVTKDGGGGSSGGGGPPGGQPPGGGTVSCSIAENSPYPNGKFTATASGGPSGQDYNWAWPHGACSGVINGNQLSMNCGATQCGNCSVRVNSFSNPNSVATCSFSNCPSGGCEIEVPPEQPVILQVATDGKEDFSGSWQRSFKGITPLLGVDLYATPSMANVSAFVSEYRFDCTSDGSFEATRKVNPQQGGFASAVAVDACDYRNPGVYTARVIAWGGRQFMPSGELGGGTAVITVDPPLEQFNIDDIIWSIQSGTPRYRADYDYDGNGVLNKSDRDILLAVVSDSKQCPQSPQNKKNCDVNGNEKVNISDVFAYTIYLRTYDVQIGTIAASNVKANISLSSSKGATVNLTSNAPSGHSVVPSLVSVSKGGIGNAELRLPILTTEKSYSITITGVAGGGTTLTSLPITLNMVSAPLVPLVVTPVPDFGLNKNKDIFVNIVGTQPVTSNSTKITVEVFDGFASNVNLSVQSVSPALAGAVFNFSDSSLSPSEFLSGSDFSVTVPANTLFGRYDIKLKGVDGGLVTNINVILNVNTKDPSFREI